MVPTTHFARWFAFPVLCVVATPAFGAAPRDAFIPFGTVADAPAGFAEMCAADAVACGTDTDAATSSSVRDETVGVAPKCVTIASSPFGFEQTPATNPDFVNATFDGAPKFFASPSLMLTRCSEPNSTTPTYFTSGALASVSLDTVEPPSRLSGRIEDNKALWSLARRVNRRVNDNVIQRSDLDNFGVDELWRRAGAGRNATGDCEDIAVEKRVELIQAGFPRDRLFLATVFESRIGLHTVLIVRLMDGDYVLDSRRGDIVPWQRAHYSWLRLQAIDNPVQWRRLGHA